MQDPSRWLIRGFHHPRRPNDEEELAECRQAKDELQTRLELLKLKAEQHIGFIELDRMADDPSQQCGDVSQHHCA